MIRTALAAMLTMLSAAGSASAAELEGIYLDELTDELVPALELHTGRTFLQVPSVRVVTRDELYQHVLEGQLAIRRLMGMGPISPEELATWADHTSDAVGFYTYSDRRIYLVSTGLEDLRRDFVVPDGLEQPLVRCVLAHELVHALQHQYQPHPKIADAAQEPVARMLREGHANLVANPFCQPDAVKRFFRFNDGLDVLAAHGTGTELAFQYGYGQRYLELLTDRHGAAAGWWVLSAEPPDRQTVAAAVEPGLVQGWRGGGVLDGAALALMWPGATGEVSPASPAELLQHQQGAAGVTALRSTQAGLMFAASDDHRAVNLMAFGFADADEARRQLELRRDTLEAARNEGDELFFFGPVSGFSTHYRVKDSKKLRDTSDAAFEVQLQVDGGRTYLETWAVRDGLLVAAAVTGQALRPRDLANALNLILAQDLPTRPPPISPDTPLGLEVPKALPEPSPSWEYPFLQVFRDIDAEQWDACIDGVDRMLPGAPADALPHIVQVGWTCGLASEDGDTATRFLDQLDDLSDLDLELLIGHAALFSQDQRWRDCLAILERIEAGGHTLPIDAVDLKIACLVETGQLTAAAAMARRQQGSAMMRLQVSYALLNKNRRQESMPILREACPRVSGNDRQDCLNVMDQLTPRRR